MRDEGSYVCESCGEEIVVPIDLSAGSTQEYVEDCPVCCHPHVVHVEIDEEGVNVAAMAKRREKADIRERFGDAVRARREELGLTQEDLAEKAGIHRTYLSDVERGSRNVSLVNIERLAAGLGFSMSGLFGLVERYKRADA